MLQQAIEERSTLPDDWRNATTFSDYRCRLSPPQARRLIDAVTDLVEQFERAEELSPDDPDGVPVTVMFAAFPRPGGRFGGTS